MNVLLLQALVRAVRYVILPYRGDDVLHGVVVRAPRGEPLLARGRDCIRLLLHVHRTVHHIHARGFTFYTAMLNNEKNTAPNNEKD